MMLYRLKSDLVLNRAKYLLDHDRTRNKENFVQVITKEHVYLSVTLLKSNLFDQKENVLKNTNRDSCLAFLLEEFGTGEDIKYFHLLHPSITNNS